MSLVLSVECVVKILIFYVMFALMFPFCAQGEEPVPIHTWDRGLAATPTTSYQYFGFCSGQDCSRMRKPRSLGSAPFSVIPDSSIEKPFIVKTPFAMPYEKESDIWKGMAAFVKQILQKQ
jgi:hypothetical protein